MKKLKFLSVFAVITGLLLMNSCSEEFLEITPNGSLDQSVLATYDGVDALLIGAYSLLDGYHQWIWLGISHLRTGYLVVSGVWKPIREPTPATSRISILFRPTLKPLRILT